MNKYGWMPVIVFFLFSCKEEWQSALYKIEKSRLYNNDLQGWKLVQEIKNEWDTNFTIEKIEGDTSKVLFFSQGNKDGIINVIGYHKTFKCSENDTCFLKMTSRDTLFFYRQHNDEKFFEVGEYAYRFTYFKMDSAEANYYLDHEDSLRRIRGNNLPKLSGGTKK